MQHELTKRAKVAEIRDALLGGSSLPDEKKTEIMAEAAATIQALFEALSTPHPVSNKMWSAGDDEQDDSRDFDEDWSSRVSSDLIYNAMERARVAENF